MAEIVTYFLPFVKIVDRAKVTSKILNVDFQEGVSNWRKEIMENFYCNRHPLASEHRTCHPPSLFPFSPLVAEMAVKDQPTPEVSLAEVTEECGWMGESQIQEGRFAATVSQDSCSC